MKTVSWSVGKRIAALLIAVLLLIPLITPFGTGTAPAAAETEEASVPALLSGSPDSGLITESAEYLYLLQKVLECKTEISVTDLHLDVERLGELFSMLFYSEAELFFLNGRYYYSCIEGSNVVQTISPVYAYDAAEVPAMLAEFHALTNEILAKVDPKTSDWEKVAFIHDYVALHYDYDHRVYSKDENVKAQAVYDAYNMLKEKIGVCQAYSLLTRDLLKKLGVECECVSCDGLNHEWNIVKIGNAWYHMDVTWDDRDDKGFYGQVSHEFFLASDSYFDVGVSEDRSHHSETGWVSPVRATNGKYDATFADVTTPFVYTTDGIYAISDGKLVTYDPETETFSVLRDLGLSWRDSGVFGIGGGTWNGTYAGLWYLNGKLYWNGSKKVYSYDPVTQAEPTVICTYNGHSKLIFGMRASTDGSAVTFTLALMADPNSGNVTEEVYTAGGYVITWNVAGSTYETVCLPGETPRYDGSLELPSNLFDYTFVQWDKTVRSASANATYTAQFRMDRNETTLEDKTLREQYRLIRAAILLLPYANTGYAEASARIAELDGISADFASRVNAVNAAFNGALFGDD
ncbi:MAG: hypothetical protein J6Z13_08210 [Clostridia bacterium]|nr:hypothetical protein [Clostridia bacterium]